ncbi:hypothetical protein HFO56_00265 [Rhizobium laguerreae]|uniref:hypothetical protein n=1 Tax=Rhizobium laguerreae TaxID=1076926 RepID=UPI001C915F0C|nr:hypothetical protein [Rhizobium laguerreae]MBY3150862.1 hypothetical protein [Rhizobium laguerreae]
MALSASYHRPINLRQLSAEPVGTVVHRKALSALTGDSLWDRLAGDIGPILCHFALSLVERTQDLDRVWFMARDGYIPMRLYDLFSGPASPKSAYLHVSRKSLMSASSRSYGMREAFLAQWNGGDDLLSTLLTPLCFSSDELEELVRRHGFSSLSERVDYRTDARFHALVSDVRVRARMASLNTKARAGLHDYLEKSGFLDDANVAVVDVGWAGQIQEALEMSLDQVQRKPKIKGLYLALRDLGGQRRAAGLDMEGLLFDCARPRWRAEAVLAAVDIFEDTCRAHHGTVTGYHDGEPIHASETPSRRSELSDEPRLAKLHEAILRYAGAFAVAAKDAGATAADIRDVAESAALTLVRFPDTELYEFFSTIGHSLDFGVDVALPTESRAPLLNPIAAVRGMKSARWKEGYVTGSVFRLPLQAALTVFRLRRRGWSRAGGYVSIGTRRGRLENAAIALIHKLARR